MSLTSKQRRELRARAHVLSPVVTIGHRGVTDAVIRQIDTALTDHELIKVRLAPECPIERHDAGSLIVAGTRSGLAGIIGRVLILYRARAEKPTIQLAGPGPEEEP